MELARALLERPEKLAVPCSPASQEATEALIATDMLSHAGCFSSLHPDRSRPAPLLPFDRELRVARAAVGTPTLRLSRPHIDVEALLLATGLAALAIDHANALWLLISSGCFFFAAS